MESVRIWAAFSGAGARVAASLALGGAAVSCAALIGIDDRLADDAPSLDASLDAPSAVDGAMDDASTAVPLTYGVGDGHTGPRVIMNGNTVVNSYAALGARASGTNTLRLQALRGEPFATGRTVKGASYEDLTRRFGGPSRRRSSRRQSIHRHLRNGAAA